MDKPQLLGVVPLVGGHPHSVPITSGVYKITESRTDRVYIGSAVHLKNRYYVHRADLKKGRHCNKYLQASFNRSPSTFYFEVIELIEPGKVLEREEFWIGHYDSCNAEKGYNLCPHPTKGTTGLHWNHTPEGRANISKGLTGLKTGPRSPEARANIAASLKGKKRSAESIAKGAASNRGKKRGPYNWKNKHKIAESSRRGKGRPKSAETRKRMSVAAKLLKARQALSRDRVIITERPDEP